MSQARVLDDRDLKRLLLYIQTQPHAARNRCMMLMTHWAGMRIGEVAALRLVDVLAPDGTVKEAITLSAAQTKGDRPRTVLVSKRLQAELTQYLRFRFGLKKLDAVLGTDTQRALFPTQKRVRVEALVPTRFVSSFTKSTPTADSPAPAATAVGAASSPNLPIRAWACG